VAGAFNNTTKREGKIKDKQSSVTRAMVHFKTWLCMNLSRSYLEGLWSLTRSLILPRR